MILLTRSRSALALALIAAVVVGCSSAGAQAKPSTDAFGSGSSASAPPSAAPVSAAPAARGAPATAAACPTKAPAPLPAGQTRTVTVETARGRIVIKVEANLGPSAAGNFVALAQCGFYAGIIFHRLVPGFVIQGGDPTGTGGGGPGYQFADDPVNVPYSRGTVAMANAGPDTNGSQFFIVLADAGLPPAYSVFGRVTGGVETGDTIAAMPHGGGEAGTA